jgi:radical SAM superfamily enzyme YgiQ (UPF0313 family)
VNVLIVSANIGWYPDPVFPLGACIVATVCKEQGHEVETFDCNFQSDIHGALCAKLKQFCPDVIGVSMRNVDDVSYPHAFSFLPHYKSLIQSIREQSSAPIVLGGSAVTLFPQKYHEILTPDYCIAGDGERAMAALLETIEGGGAAEPVIHATPVAYDDEYSVMPDYRLFDMNRYYEQGGMLNLQTKRGCVFACSFCTFPALEGRKIRICPAQRVVGEMERIVQEFGIRHIFITDSVFNASLPHAVEICEEIIRRKLRIRWSCYIRPALDDPDILGLMKRAGCTSIELGTESMAEETLESLNKQFGIDEIVRVCEKCHEFRLPFCHSIMFGAPGESVETVKKTIENVERTNPTAVIATAGIRLYPKTLLADYLVKTGYIESIDAIGLEPMFFIEEGVREWIFPYLDSYAKTHSKWIVPGRLSEERTLVRKLRAMQKKGSAWQFKGYEQYV